MENRSYALAAGLFLLVLVVAAALAGHRLGGAPIDRVPYRVVSTHTVSGLNPQGQVRYRGISVGRVERIELDPADARRILVEIEVDKGTPITRGTYAQLAQEGITGIAYVHLLDEGKDPRPPQAAPDGRIEIDMRASAMDDVFETAASLTREARDVAAGLKEVVAGLNLVLGEDNRGSVAATLTSLKRITAELETVSKQLPRAVARVDRNLEGWLSDDNQKLARDTLQRLNDSARELPALSQETRKLVEDARQVAAQVTRLANEAQHAAGNVREGTLPRINALADSAERGAERIGRLAYELERRPDSVVWGRPQNRPGPGEAGFE